MLIGRPMQHFNEAFLLRKLSRSCFPKLSKREQRPLRVKQVPLQNKDNFMRAAGHSQSKQGRKQPNVYLQDVHLFIYLFIYLMFTKRGK